jgi:hypothetical protein
MCKIKQMAFVLAFFAMQLPVHSQEKNDELETHCFKLAKLMANQHEWISFKVKTSHFQGDSLLWIDNMTCSVHYGDESLFYVNDQSKDIYSCLTGEEYKEIDTKSKNIVIYPSSEKEAVLAYLKYGIGGILASFFDILYYLYPTFLGEMKIVDEIFIDEKVISMTKGNRIKFFLEKSVVGKDIEEDMNVIHSEYFIVPASGLLDSVCAFTQIDGTSFETRVSIYDFDFYDKQISIDSVFDFEKPIFEGFSYKRRFDN